MGCICDGFFIRSMIQREELSCQKSRIIHLMFLVQSRQKTGILNPLQVCLHSSKTVKSDMRPASPSTLLKASHKVCIWFLDQECMKRRKQHRRRRVNNQEQCMMRGVYFKNMKWQAAIKVDKKQIHLGTVSSPEEAAHLYDRYGQ